MARFKCYSHRCYGRSGLTRCTASHFPCMTGFIGARQQQAEARVPRLHIAAALYCFGNGRENHSIDWGIIKGDDGACPISPSLLLLLAALSSQSSIPSRHTASYKYARCAKHSCLFELHALTQFDCEPTAFVSRLCCCVSRWDAHFLLAALLPLSLSWLYPSTHSHTFLSTLRVCQ